MLRFRLHTLYWYCKVNIGAIKDFFIRNTLVAVIFFIQWILGNGIWYYISVFGTGWLRAFAISYIGFLYTPAAMEKFVYFFVARWVAKRILKIRKTMNLEPKWQKAYKNITLFPKIIYKSNEIKYER